MRGLAVLVFWVGGILQILLAVWADSTGWAMLHAVSGVTTLTFAAIVTGQDVRKHRKHDTAASGRPKGRA